MKTLLVTGGAGFIGANFVHYIFEQEPELNIVVLDLLTYAGRMENLRDVSNFENFHFIQGDINNDTLVAGILKEYQVDTVVHFAAESHVDRSISGPSLFIRTNLNGTFTLLEKVKEYWLEEKNLPLDAVRFHHISTDEVFGTLGVDESPFNHLTPYAPRSPYAASKAGADHLVRAYYHTYGLPVSISNCSNNYGPYQYPEKMVPLIILNAVSGKPIPIYGDGRQIRDWLYVKDHCQAIYQILQAGKLGETYLVGGENQIPNNELVEEICSILDELIPSQGGLSYRDLITHVADRPGHDRRYAIEIGKIYSELGWKPSYDLKTGLTETVRWYLQNPEWAAAIQGKGEYQEWINKNYLERGKNG